MPYTIEAPAVKLPTTRQLKHPSGEYMKIPL